VSLPYKKTGGLPCRFLVKWFSRQYTGLSRTLTLPSWFQLQLNPSSFFVPSSASCTSYHCPAFCTDIHMISVHFKFHSAVLCKIPFEVPFPLSPLPLSPLTHNSHPYIGFLTVSFWFGVANIVVDFPCMAHSVCHMLPSVGFSSYFSALKMVIHSPKMWRVSPNYTAFQPRRFTLKELPFDYHQLKHKLEI
jgi:hypothetical protein